MPRRRRREEINSECKEGVKCITQPKHFQGNNWKAHRATLHNGTGGQGTPEPERINCSRTTPVMRDHVLRAKGNCRLGNLPTPSAVEHVRTHSKLINNAKRGTLTRGALQYSGLRSSQILSNLLKSPSDGLKSTRIFSNQLKKSRASPEIF